MPASKSARSSASQSATWSFGLKSKVRLRAVLGDHLVRVRIGPDGSIGVGHVRDEDEVGEEVVLDELEPVVEDADLLVETHLIAP